MNKHILRKKMLKNLKQLRAEEKKHYEQTIHKRLLTSELWQQASIIGLTYSRDIEWNTIPLLQTALKTGKIVVLPKSDPIQHTMTFYIINHINQLQPGYAEIWEPDPMKAEEVRENEIDLLIVPGIAFDSRGFRIGFGGGYYDRYLKHYQKTSVSLAAEFQLMNPLPTESFDLPVQYIFTEKRLIATKAKI